MPGRRDSGAEMRENLARHLHRAEPPSAQPASDAAVELRGEEAPVEANVLGDEDVSVDRVEHRLGDVAERRRLLYVLPANAREPGHKRRDRTLRVHEEIQRGRCDAVAHVNDRHLHDPVGAVDSTTGRLDIDHREAQRPKVVLGPWARGDFLTQLHGSSR